MEQRLAQAHVDLQKANASLADKTDKSDVLESRERQLNEQLAKSNLEIERLKEALVSAESKSAESLKTAENMRGKYNDTQLKLHEVTGREQCVQRELDDAKHSLESEIKSVADREAELLREQAYCRSLENELADFKSKFRTSETELLSARETHRHDASSLAELEVSLNTTRASMSAEQIKLQQDLVLARLAVEQMCRAADQKSEEVKAELDRVEGGADVSAAAEGGGAEAKEGAGDGSKKKKGKGKKGKEEEAGEATKTGEEAAETAASGMEQRAISDMAAVTCQQIHDLGKRVVRLQQQNSKLLEQVAQVEDLRLSADTLRRDKYLAEEELTRIRTSMDAQKQDLETLRKTKARLETELATAQSEIDDVKASMKEMDATHSKAQMAAASQRAVLEAHRDELKRTLAETEARMTELKLALDDSAQARAFLVDAIACVSRIHRAIAASEAPTAYAGVGVAVRLEGDECVITGLDQSEAGKQSRAMLPHTILVGHVIESIDGYPVRGLSKNSVLDLMIGAEGSDAKIAARSREEGAEEYRVVLKRYLQEESPRTVSERTADSCARASRFLSEIEALKSEVALKSADSLRKEEMILESVRAREASNKQLLVLEEQAKAHQAEKDALQSEIDILQLQLKSSKEQAVELDGRHEQDVAIIAHSQVSISELEMELSAARRGKTSLEDSVSRLEREVAGKKQEAVKMLEDHLKRTRELEVQVENLHSQLLEQAKTSTLLMDAEKREEALRRSLAAFESERNAFKHETQVLSKDLASARQALDARASELQTAERALVDAQSRIEELDGLLNCVQDQTAMATRAEHERSMQLRDAHSKGRMLLEAMKGTLTHWQGVGMVVRCGNKASHTMSATPTTIKTLRPGGPAWTSGVLHDGDVLVSVDGKSVSGLDVREIQALILGPVGTTVNIVARPARGGRNVSVDLVRGDAVTTEQSWDEEVSQAVNAATAMHAHGATSRKVVQGLVHEAQRKDADVEMALVTVENSYNDARLSWQDVSSAISSFSTHRESTKSISDKDGSRSGRGALDGTSDAGSATEGDAAEFKCTEEVVSQVQAGTINSKKSLARIAELTKEYVETVVARCLWLL
jgi:C-terminal processing protease CtpA/Prc